MSGLDKILGHIEQSATETANKMIESAKAEAERIVAEGKASAQAKEAAINKQCEIDVAGASKKVESAADMTKKRIILQSKQQEIDSVLDAALEELKNLDSREYFNIILKMVAKYALAREGEIEFSDADLKRLPAGFEAKVNAEAAKAGGSLKIAKESAKIDGGFILVYGDVEENCSFEALISASKEDLQDKIGQILFN